MARTELSAGLLLLLTCCSANAQGWRSWWTWGNLEKTTFPPTEAARTEEQTALHPGTPEETTPLNVPVESTTEQKGSVWTVLTPGRPDLTAATTTPPAASLSQLEGTEGNITGAGAEILSTTEGSGNLLQFGDEKATEGAKTEEAPVAADPVTALPLPVTEPVSIQNTTANSTGDVQTSAETGQPELALAVTTKQAVLWNETRVLLKKPEIPLPENFSTEVGLLELIGDPPPEQITKVYGPDNSPGYVFGLDANTGQVARYHLPSPFYRDFSLLFHVQPTRDKAGVLFAITDASQSIIYVGVKLSEVKDGKQQIIFYYTEPGSQNSYAAATFVVPSLVDRWTRFAISVEEEEVILYMDCEEYERVRFERSPDEMELEDGSGLFVAQAGGADPDKYQGVIAELKVKGDPQAAEVQCEEEEDDSDIISGDGGSGAEEKPRLPERERVSPKPFSGIEMHLWKCFL
ncbi:Collagen alpha-1(XVIII) chain [Varanus komodoensis]|nr:Collagen alpha-1(XVIII) chain [Varanus komodoensis]